MTPMASDLAAFSCARTAVGRPTRAQGLWQSAQTEHRTAFVDPGSDHIGLDSVLQSPHLQGDGSIGLSYLRLQSRGGPVL
jgi:hypothetical protein